MRNKAIVITGANSGIGLECVIQFTHLFKDNKVIALSKSIHNLQSLSIDNLEIKQCDVTDYEKLKSHIVDINTNYEIVLVINSAGIAYYNDFCHIENNKIQQMIDVNINGLTNMIELVLPYMREKKLGTIINISSLADRYPRPLGAVYAASKSYVKSLTDSLRISEAKYNIRLCNISPALIETPLSKLISTQIPSREFTTKISTKDFVNIIVFTYMQPQSICIRDMVVAPTGYEN